MKVRRRVTLDRSVGETWAVMAIDVPIASRPWALGRLTTPIGELPEQGGVVAIVEPGDEGPMVAGTAELLAYRPPRLLRWRALQPLPLLGELTGSYRVTGEDPATVEVELGLDGRRGVVRLLSPLLALLMRRTATRLLSELAATVTTREPVEMAETERVAMRVEARDSAERRTEQRLHEGRVYAFRVSRGVLDELARDHEDGAGCPELETTTRDLVRQILARPGKSHLVSVTVREARELRGCLQRLAESGSQPERLTEEARAGLAALESTLASEHLVLDRQDA